MGRNDLTGKGKKALLELKAIQEEVHTIEGKLKKASEILQNAIESLESCLRPKRPENGAKRSSGTGKYAECPPKRVKFKYNHLEFYIDFAIAPSESSDPTNIQGIIIYGVRRTLCFPDLIMKGEKSETKALIQFSVNRHGMIQSNDAFEDIWSLGDKEHNLLDMHCRTLDHIWGQALDWVNENIVP